MRCGRSRNLWSVLAIGLLISTTCLAGELELPAIFSDGMVLQQGMTVPVWGVAAPEAKVKVSFGGQEEEATANAEGTWEIRLDELKASSTPSSMAITSGNDSQTVKDVLIGEVWFCSGQSNMAMALYRLGRKLKNKKAQSIKDYIRKEMKTADDPLLRQFTVNKSKKLEVVEGKWISSNPKQTEKFSGTAYFFGRELRRELKVPVGLIHSAVGGTKIELWVPESGPLFKGLVSRFIPFAIRGVIWYQGEANTKGKVDTYEETFKAMIPSWRENWGQGEFPFYFVQLASFKDSKKEPVDVDNWALICEQQRRALSVKNTGMVVANDIGDAKNIHCKNKIDVGKRLALWALKKDYSKDIPACSGPLYRRHEIRGGKIIITFDHAGSGLMTGHKNLMSKTREVNQPLKRFQICGEDRQWKWAQAKIVSKDTLAVFHPEIANPTIVRYAWAANPEGANLYNKEGLPASIFTTEKKLPPVAPRPTSTATKKETTETKRARKRRSRDGK